MVFIVQEENISFVDDDGFQLGEVEGGFSSAEELLELSVGGHDNLGGGLGVVDHGVAKGNSSSLDDLLVDGRDLVAEFPHIDNANYLGRRVVPVHSKHGTNNEGTSLSRPILSLSNERVVWLSGDHWNRYTLNS